MCCLCSQSSCVHCDMQRLVLPPNLSHYARHSSSRTRATLSLRRRVLLQTSDARIFKNCIRVCIGTMGKIAVHTCVSFTPVLYSHPFSVHTSSILGHTRTIFLDHMHVLFSQTQSSRADVFSVGYTPYTAVPNPHGLTITSE